jgi:hypothetical protein
MASSEEYQDASTDYGPLTQRQAENIADLAARRAQERMYAEIGRSVVAKALYTIGAACIAAAAWLNGWFSIGHAK